MMRNEIFWLNHLRPPSHAASSYLILVSVPANWQIVHPRKFAIDHMSIGVLRVASFVTYTLGSGSCAGGRPSRGCMLCCICFVQTDIHGLTVTPRTRTHHAAGVLSSHSVIKVPYLGINSIIVPRDIFASHYRYKNFGSFSVPLPNHVASFQSCCKQT